MLTVLTWLWQQQGSRFKYNADHVNVWATAIKNNTTVEVEFACVTDIPEGIESWIRIIEPPKDFENIVVGSWAEHRGMPQCFRRISMFRPDAEKIFGQRFVCIDLDVVVLGNMDKILSCTDDFRIMQSTSPSIRPYNGGIIMMNAGARPQVYKKFNQKNAEIACSKFVGSDQAWISHCLGQGEQVFTYDEHGVAFLTRTRMKRFRLHIVDNCNISIGMFPGKPKFFMNGQCHKALKYEVEIMNSLLGQELWDKANAAENVSDIVIRMPKKTKKSRGRRYHLNRL